MENKRTWMFWIGAVQLATILGIRVFGDDAMTIQQSTKLLAISLLLFWFLKDIAEPLYAGRLRELKRRQKSGWPLWAFCNLAMMAGIAGFAHCAALGNNRRGILWAVLAVAAGCTGAGAKRKKETD